MLVTLEETEARRSWESCPRPRSAGARGLGGGGGCSPGGTLPSTGRTCCSGRSPLLPAGKGHVGAQRCSEAGSNFPAVV